MTTMRASLIALPLLAILLACGADSDTAGGAAEGDVGAASTVRTASLPDPCELVSVAEIERIIGTLDGSPQREDGGCRYFVPLDTSGPEWARAREFEQALQEQGAEIEPFANFERIRPSLFIDVDVTGRSVIGERGIAAMTAHFAAGLGDAATNPGEAHAAPSGVWDHVGSPPGRAGFIGRSGHVTVALALERLGVPPDTLEALARDILGRVPDLPFPDPAADLATAPGPGPDPCSLLTREEAEEELGPLLVPPFRAREETPQVDPAGARCAYHTAGHRVLLLTPEWTYGRSTLDAARIGGGLVGMAVDVPGVNADTLAGSWDDAATDAATGDLIFVSGSRSLTVSYLMSSADAAAAIRLAERALARLGEAPSTRPQVREGADAKCPLTAAEASEILGMTLLFSRYYGSECLFDLEEDPMVYLTLSTRPAAAAPEVFDDIRMRARADLGQGHDAQRLELGEGGWVLGTSSRSEAAAVANGKLYYAELEYMISTTMGDRSEEVTRMLAKMMQ